MQQGNASEKGRFASKTRVWRLGHGHGTSGRGGGAALRSGWVLQLASGGDSRWDWRLPGTPPAGKAMVGAEDPSAQIGMPVEVTKVRVGLFTSNIGLRIYDTRPRRTRQRAKYSRWTRRARTFPSSISPPATSRREEVDLHRGQPHPSRECRRQGADHAPQDALRRRGWRDSGDHHDRRAGHDPAGRPPGVLAAAQS